MGSSAPRSSSVAESISIILSMQRDGRGSPPAASSSGLQEGPMATQMVSRRSLPDRLRSTRMPGASVVTAAVLSLAVAGSAAARSFTPRHHRIFHGVSDTTNNKDFHRFQKRVGAHPAVLEDFYHWDTPLISG